MKSNKRKCQVEGVFIRWLLWVESTSTKKKKRTQYR